MNGARDKPLMRPLLTVVGLLAAGALVWFVGPLAAVGDAAPLASDAARWALLTSMAALAAAYTAWRAARAERRNRLLMESLVASTVAMPAPAPGANEVAVIGKRFEDAVALLKRSRMGGRHPLLAALAGQPYVYQLPWYLIIGAPGAGKTTALVNSGLEFPLADKLGEKVIRGIAGTRDCDWWFANDAVLIDTAGRYTTHESHREADRAAWLGFLGLLTRYRPRRPINGVLLTVSVSDLLSVDRDKRLAHARELSGRIEELHTRLGIRFPIYVLVTKTDLLAGFMEFFADFDKDERAQVWGVTFPYDAKSAPQDPLARMASDFAALEKRLNDCLIERLHAEHDRERRAVIYAFPQQWRVLHATLLEFLRVALAPARSEARPLVRGVYFTSATQEGTPIDRALGGLARALGLTSRIVPPARPSGKTFFVTRLLRDVVFAEAGLAGTNPRWQRRRALFEWGLVAASVVVVAGACVLSWRAYAENRDYVAAVAERASALDIEVQAAKNASPTDLAALLPALDSLKSLALSNAAPQAGPANLQMGLDQTEMLGAAAQDAYQRLLKDAFLPRIAARLEERLRGGKQDHVELIYETLRAYLMLFSGKNFDPDALRGYLGADWDATLPASVSAQQRDALRGHLDQLLALGEVGAPSHADPKLIAKSRGLVGSVPLAERVYSRLKQLDLGTQAPEFTVESAGGPAARRVFVRASGQPLTRGVPGLYSSAVFQQSFRERTQDVLRQFAGEESWVLGTSTPSAAEPAAQAALQGEVERLYVADYTRRWTEFVNDLRIATPANLAASAEIAGVLAAPESPLTLLLGAVVREVSVAPRSQPPGDASPERAEGKLIDPKFEPLRAFVTGPAPAGDEMPALLGRLSTHLADVQEATRHKTVPAASNATRETAAFAQRAPEPVRGMLTQLAAASAAQAFAALREPIARQLASELTAPCTRALSGRYPLVRSSSEEMTREEFSRLFGAGGLVDGFFQRNLAAYVDTSTRPWAYQRAAGGRVEQAESLQQFQRAQSIRDAFFQGGGRTIGVRLEFRLLDLDASVSQFTLDVDGQALSFGRDATKPQSVQWPGPSGAGRVQLQLTPVAGGGGPGHVFDGPWALFRLFDRVRVEPGATPGRAQLVFDVEGRKARFEVRSTTPVSPVQRQELEQFRCPNQL